jgi:hypothetical protein
VPQDYKIIHGLVRSANQIYPNNDTAIPIPREKEIILRLEYGYDTFMAACSGTGFYAFRVKSDGTVVDLGEIQRPDTAQMYDNFDGRIGR